jgi:hypothetical protein
MLVVVINSVGVVKMFFMLSIIVLGVGMLSVVTMRVMAPPKHLFIWKIENEKGRNVKLKESNPASVLDK